MNCDESFKVLILHPHNTRQSFETHQITTTNHLAHSHHQLTLSFNILSLSSSHSPHTRTRIPSSSMSLIINQDQDQEKQMIIMKKDEMIVSSSSSSSHLSHLWSSNIQLVGHGAEVNGIRFRPGDGELLASCSTDRTVMIWSVFEEASPAKLCMRGHKHAVLDVEWSYDGSRVVSGSADKSVMVWDAESGQRIKKWLHRGVVNAVSSSRHSNNIVASASDDKSVRLWDDRTTSSSTSNADLVMSHPFQCTAVAMNGDGTGVFSGGLDGVIREWDLRTGKVRQELEGHSDTITGLRMSVDGMSYLLSNAMDGQLRVWDIRPFFFSSTTKNALVMRFRITRPISWGMIFIFPID